MGSGQEHKAEDNGRREHEAGRTVGVGEQVVQDSWLDRVG